MRGNGGPRTAARRAGVSRKGVRSGGREQRGAGRRDEERRARRARHRRRRLSGAGARRNSFGSMNEDGLQTRLSAAERKQLHGQNRAGDRRRPPQGRTGGTPRERHQRSRRTGRVGALRSPRFSQGPCCPITNGPGVRVRCTARTCRISREATPTMTFGTSTCPAAATRTSPPPPRARVAGEAR